MRSLTNPNRKTPTVRVPGELPPTRKLPQNACNVRVGDQNVKPKEYGRLGAGEKIQQSRFIKDFHTELLSLFELLPASSPATT
jgi:hypothetical protein